jgi:hypothetical protein
MGDSYEYWDPNEWEQHVYGLLQDRHGPLNITKVPARHIGDFGIDYYSLSDRVAYQCYAVQEPCDVKTRAENQKSKITTDIKKFCEKKKELSSLFGTTKIDRWVLVVPLHDSIRVNVHLTSKTTEVRALNLPYTSSGFEATIQDLESFDAKSLEYRERLRKEINLPVKKYTDDEIEQWSEDNPHVANLEKKLKKRIGADPEQLQQAVREAIGWFLEQSNTLEALRESAPQLHEMIFEVISRRTDRLRFYGPPSDGTPHHILRTEVEGLINELQERIPNFAASSANLIALGTVTEWLLRCPLDFPPYET